MRAHWFAASLSLLVGMACSSPASVASPTSVATATRTSPPTNTASATTTITPTVAPTVVPTETPTAVPTVAPTPAPTVPPVAAKYSVSGNATYATTGAPVTSYTVYLYAMTPDLCTSLAQTGQPFPTAGTTVQSTDGTYLIQGVPAGTYLMGIASRGSETAKFGNWWYNGTPNCASATPLVVNRNLSIRFSVQPR